MTEFGSLNHSQGKRVLNNLKTICLRFWKVVVQTVAVIKLEDRSMDSKRRRQAGTEYSECVADLITPLPKCVTTPN